MSARNRISSQRRVIIINPEKFVQRCLSKQACPTVRGSEEPSPLPVSLDQSRKSYSNGLIADRFLEIAINSFNEPSCILYDRLSLAPPPWHSGLAPNRIHLNTWPSSPPPPFNSWFYELLRSLKLGEKAINAHRVCYS